ncbi:plasmid segregation protein ParM [Clostridium beijerinckii]|uniref:ParM/StbA family protein n=1 Tax=Clostridium beijerinckii TaxID=1520 RepID=UPI0014942417|nr:ParM/StbA family protein [Clostridium beijerinckii]NOW85507.1 plasmid segregation protein ParM [Clostridium beijerinckii]
METIGTDFGSCNLKTSTGIIVPSKVTKCDSSFFGAEYLVEIEGESHIVGEGEYDTILDKTKKENFLPMLCLALGLSTHEQATRVVAGLPIGQYKSKEKEKLEQMLQDNKMLNFKLNGVERQIIIENSAVTAEGIATYYSLPVELRNGLRNKDIILLDIGGRTSDIALLKAGKKRRIDESTSLEVGMINIYKDVVNKVNSKYTLGLDIEDAENILKHGLEVDGEKQDTEFIKEILMNNIKKVFKELNVSYPVRTAPLLVTGGGGEAFFKAINRRYPTAIMAPNHMFSNAIGYKRVGEKLWRD